MAFRRSRINPRNKGMHSRMFSAGGSRWSEVNTVGQIRGDKLQVLEVLARNAPMLFNSTIQVLCRFLLDIYDMI